MSYKKFEFATHEDYLSHQIHRHRLSKERTANRPHKRYIDKVESQFSSVKKILCVGARDVSEVKAFINREYEAIGIDLFSADKNIIRLVDMHNIAQDFKENEFDLIFSCHSLEHSLYPDVVLQSFQKVSRIGAFIVLPFHAVPNSKDPVVLPFMELGGYVTCENPGDGVTKELVQNDLNNLLLENKKCEVVDLEIYPLKGTSWDHSDGYWISVNWNK
jgi:hypothetical protein